MGLVCCARCCVQRSPLASWTNPWQDQAADGGGCALGSLKWRRTGFFDFLDTRSCLETVSQVLLYMERCHPAISSEPSREFPQIQELSPPVGFLNNTKTQEAKRYLIRNIKLHRETGGPTYRSAKSADLHSRRLVT